MTSLSRDTNSSSSTPQLALVRAEELSLGFREQGELFEQISREENAGEYAVRV